MPITPQPVHLPPSHVPIHYSGSMHSFPYSLGVDDAFMPGGDELKDKKLLIIQLGT